MSGGWWNVQYDHRNLHGKLGKGESMTNSCRKDGKRWGLPDDVSTRNVDHLSRQAELHHLTVQVGRVAKSELDVYRKVGCAYNA